MDNNAKAIRSGVWYTVANFFTKGIGFITAPIFTRLLTKAEFGVYNNYLSWLAIFSIIITMHMESTLLSARFDFEDKLDEYILSMLSLTTVIALAWMLFFNAFMSRASSFLGLDPVYINVMMVYLIFYQCINFYQIKERYSFEYKKN